jgi:YHS domain-containing protein
MRFTFAPLLSLSLLVVACGGGGAENAAPQTPKADAPSAKSGDKPAADVKKPGEAAMGDKTSCPISKEVFTVSASSPKVEYKGKTYYFCCGGCDAKFKENPEKYLAPSPAAP